MDLYRERIESRSQGLSATRREEEHLIREFQLVGVKAEREALLALGRARTIGSEVARKLTRELDLSEARYRG
jgi:CPA1 family monovalent cation:H+ antiporter